MTAQSTLTLEDIRDLCDEVRLLVVAGLPLESHLAEAGRGYGQRLQRVAQAIDEGLSQGRSLDQVIDSETPGASTMLSAAVAAGIRTGKLSSMIEMMGDFASDLVDLRRQVLQAASYPLTVAALAWLLFALIIQHALSRLLSSLQQLEITLHPVLLWLLQWNDAHAGWVWGVPLLGAVLAGFWVMSGRASSMAFRGPERLLLCLPGVGILVRDLQFYTLTRMLSLLVERQVVLTEALLLAGIASGSRSLQAACRQAAERIQNGQPQNLPAGTGRRWKRGQLPPLLQASLRQPAPEAGRFVLRLQAITDHYRHRLSYNTLWMKTLMPIAMFVVIGGGAVMLYATAVFWPVIEIYRRLGAGV